MKKQKLKFEIRRCEGEFPKGRQWEIDEITFEEVSIVMKITMFSESNIIGFTKREAKAICKVLNKMYKS